MSGQLIIRFIMLVLLSSISWARADEAEVSTLQDELAQLEIEEYEVFRPLLDRAILTARNHLQERKTLDVTDKLAVRRHNERSQFLSRELNRLDCELAMCRAKQGALHDRVRLTQLNARNRILAGHIARLQFHIEQVQRLLKQLGDASLKDIKQLEEAAQQSRKIDLEFTAELLDQIVELAGGIGSLSKVLNKIDLRLLPADDKWSEFRDAVLELRESAEFFNSPDVRLMMKRFADSRNALEAAINTKHDVPATVEVDKDVVTASNLMQWVISECEHRSKVGKKLQELLKQLPLKDLEDLVGLPTLRQLSAASRYLNLGEMAITSWAAAGEQVLVNRELTRIANDIERRNALIRSFSPGGTEFLSYERHIGLLRGARNETFENEIEIAAIESRLSRSRSN